MYVIVWQYRPLEDSEKEFRKAYGPDGIWVRFFRKAEGYAGTELVREAGGSYITIDLWESREAYERFRRRHDEAYRVIDLECGSYTASEEKLAEFTTLDKKRR